MVLLCFICVCAMCWLLCRLVKVSYAFGVITRCWFVGFLFDSFGLVWVCGLVVVMFVLFIVFVVWFGLV